MSPNDIDVMLHYYGSRSVHPRIDAPAVRDAIDRFLKAGLFTQSDLADVYEVTEGGRMYVDALRAVPLPERLWTMPKSDLQVEVAEQGCY